MSNSVNPDSVNKKRPFVTTFPFKYFLSCCAATCAETLTYPLDLAKTRMQIHGCVNPVIEKRGFLKTTAFVVKEEGALKLWQGLTPAVYRHLIYTGVRMSLYELIRGERQKARPPTSVSRAALCGGFAGGVGQFLASPADLVKVQMQMEGRRRLEGHPPRLRSAGHCLRVLLKEAGIRGLWRGCIPNVQRAILVNCGDLATYDSAKGYIIANSSFFKDDMLTHAMASCMSGFVATTLSTPADVVKTRMMNQPLDANGRGAYYSGSVDCLVKTVSKEGVLALYKGFLPIWARMAPWSLTFWVSYEHLRYLTGAGSF